MWLARGRSQVAERRGPALPDPVAGTPESRESSVRLHAGQAGVASNDSRVASDVAAGVAGALRADVGPEPWGIWMAEMAVELAGTHDDLVATMDAISCDAAQAIPGVEFAALVARQSDTGAACLSATHPNARTCVEIEAQTAGPCSEALIDYLTIRVDDLAATDRWPEYRSPAMDAGVNSLICLPLAVAGRRLGALVLYAVKPWAFTDETVQVAALYAAHAAVALAAAQAHANLLAAVESRDRIGQAKGILMERYKLLDSQAFAMLTKVSQNTNTPLRLIAEQLCTTGELPALGVRRDRSIA